jgi:hypothetical protein
VVEERVDTILYLLEHRHIPVPEGARERITACTDLDTLARWRDRAFTATDVEDLFAPEP